MLELNKTKEALRFALVELKLQTDVEIVDIKHATVVILDYTQDPTKPDLGNHMIKLERWMKAYLDVKNLELQLESIDDKNKRDIKHGRAVAKTVSARNVESLD